MLTNVESRHALLPASGVIAGRLVDYLEAGYRHVTSHPNPDTSDEIEPRS